MKNLRLLAVALAALAMVSMTGCQAMIEQTPEYQMKQAEKAYKDSAYVGKTFSDKRKEDNPYNILFAEAERNRAAWKAEHPDECYDCLPLSAAPDAEKVEINGKSYYCAQTASGGIRCE